MRRKRKPTPKIEEISSSSDEERQEIQLKPNEEKEEEESSDDGSESESEEGDDEEEEEDDEEGEEGEEEGEDEDSKRNSIRKLLEPFGRDQLVDLLKSAALDNPSIVERLRRAADSDPIHRKIFIHGLGWDATSDILISAFKDYGPIEECNVVTDKSTGKSKGYGFVLFATRSAARKALKEPQKKIGSRLTACQLASTGPVPGHPAPDATGRKIYVTGITSGIDAGRLRAFFEKYGEIEVAPPSCDRGFAIFTYKTSEACKKALEEPVKLFEGCHLHCKRAIDGLRPNQNQNQKMTVQPFPGSAMLLPQNNLALNYASASASLMGLNPGLVGHQNLSSIGSGLMGHSSSLGGGLFPSVGSGLSPAVSRSGGVTSYGAGLGSVGLGGQSAINSISPSVIGSYASQAALQGLGAYQGVQSGQSPTASSRSQSGIGSLGSFPPSYFGR